MNIWILLGGLNAALAVAAGAYGWHRSEERRGGEVGGAQGAGVGYRREEGQR